MEPSGSEGERPAAPPALSVVVLTRNRVRLLERCLRAVLAQRFDAFEIVVVDNGSSDGTEAMVKREFPQVRLLRLEENAGIRGRNLGFEAARAPLVLSLDDDVELVEPDTLERVAARFAEQGDLGALSLKVCEEPDMREFAPHHWWHPPPREEAQDREFPTEHLNEAAAAFRAEALARGGRYYERLFWGGEEWDLVLGLLDAGCDVRYLPVPVRHLAPRGSLNQNADPRHALLVRNRCWIAFRRLPLPAALAFALPRLALWAARSLRHGYFDAYRKGVADLCRGLPELIRERAPVSRATRRRLARIRAQKSGRLLA